MSEIWQLQKEIYRLQAILEDNGIDYEPEQFGAPDRPFTGPPTLCEHLSNVFIQRMARRFTATLPLIYDERERQQDDMRFASGDKWSVRVRIKQPDGSETFA